MSGGTAQVEASTWREVEVGRVVIFANGPNQGQLAAIVEIVDHKRVCPSICVELVIWSSREPVVMPLSNAYRGSKMAIHGIVPFIHGHEK